MCRRWAVAYASKKSIDLSCDTIRKFAEHGADFRSLVSRLSKRHQHPCVVVPSYQISNGHGRLVNRFEGIEQCFHRKQLTINGGSSNRRQEIDPCGVVVGEVASLKPRSGSDTWLG